MCIRDSTPTGCKTKITSPKKLLRNWEYRRVAREFINKGVKVAIKGKGNGMESEQVAADVENVMNSFWSRTPIINGPFRGNVFYKDACGNYCER